MWSGRPGSARAPCFATSSSKTSMPGGVWASLILMETSPDWVAAPFGGGDCARHARRFRLEAIAPLQNKIGRLLANAPIRNVFGQVRNRFDAGFIMDRGRIMIANLSKGVIGEDHARL